MLRIYINIIDVDYNISLPDIYVIVHLFHATQSRYHFKLKVKPSYDLNYRVLSKILVISMKGFD